MGNGETNFSLPERNALDTTYNNNRSPSECGDAANSGYIESTRRNSHGRRPQHLLKVLVSLATTLILVVCTQVLEGVRWRNVSTLRGTTSLRSSVLNVENGVMHETSFAGVGGGSGFPPPGPRRARLAYLIMASGEEEVQKTKRLLKAIHDPRNFYLVHLDRKTGSTLRGDLETFALDLGDNIRMLTPSLDVSWGGYSITLTALFGLCTMVQWTSQWDYFINLSASDFPLLSQEEMSFVLGNVVGRGVNFVQGGPLNERNRVEVYVDDQGLYRNTQVFSYSRVV
ncbi:unnamed protein product [Choristocarpus tenellus]